MAKEPSQQAAVSVRTERKPLPLTQRARDVRFFMEHWKVGRAFAEWCADQRAEGRRQGK